MKYVILVLLLCAPLFLYAVDYRQEIMKHFIVPCMERSVENAIGPLSSAEKRYIAKRWIEDNPQAVNQEIEILNQTLAALDESENTYTTRQRIYIKSLPSCVGG